MRCCTGVAAIDRRDRRGQLEASGLPAGRLETANATGCSNMLFAVKTK